MFRTSGTTTVKPVSRRKNVLIEENLTPMQKLVIYLAFTGVLFMRSVSFYYQEVDYANPDHPQHEHYKDAVINKTANLVAAILIFMWYLYSTFFIERFYHKYVTRRSQLRSDSSPGQQDRQQPSEERSPTTDGRRQYDEVTEKTKSFFAMDMKRHEIFVGVVIKPDLELLFKTDPKYSKLLLPKKMTLAEFEEWRFAEIANMEVKK